MTREQYSLLATAFSAGGAMAALDRAVVSALVGLVTGVIVYLAHQAYQASVLIVQQLRSKLTAPTAPTTPTAEETTASAPLKGATSKRDIPAGWKPPTRPS